MTFITESRLRKLLDTYIDLGLEHFCAVLWGVGKEPKVRMVVEEEGCRMWRWEGEGWAWRESKSRLNPEAWGVSIQPS